VLSGAHGAGGAFSLSDSSLQVKTGLEVELFGALGSQTLALEALALKARVLGGTISGRPGRSFPEGGINGNVVAEASRLRM